MKTYDDFTYNSKNLLAKYSHNSRFKISLQIIKSIKANSLLDFGCGDGYFLNNLKNQSYNQLLIGYEPYMNIKKDFEKFYIYNKWEKVNKHVKENGLFDVITSFEVMEHFSEERQLENLRKISSVLKKSGKLVISVPIEKGFISLIKNLRRISISYSGNEKIYTFKNILSSFLGLKTKSLNEQRIGNSYLSHMGFYFDDFEKILNKHFIIEEKIFSPFLKFYHHFNSQIFYILKKK